MKTEELLKALNRLKVQTGSLACLGCGHEHNCGVHGCALIREAIDRLCASEWISTENEIPPDSTEVLVLTRSKNGSRNVDKGYWEPKQQRFVHRGTAQVTHWMPIPEMPEGGA